MRSKKAVIRVEGNPYEIEYDWYVESYGGEFTVVVLERTLNDRSYDYELVDRVAVASELAAENEVTRQLKKALLDIISGCIQVFPSTERP